MWSIFFLYLLFLTSRYFLRLFVDSDDALLEAEERAMENSKALALRNFEVAVLLAGRRGLTHLQALANERSAVYLEEVGDIDEAKYRYEQAQNLYTDWGATVKVEQVQRARDRLEAQ